MRNFSISICLFKILYLVTAALNFTPSAWCQTLTQEITLDSKASEIVRQAVYLHTAKEVAKDCEQGKFQIVHVLREEQYLAEHIPGSVFLDGSVWMKQSMDNLHDRSFWQSQLSNIGAMPNRPIVLVGQSPTTTARVWWLLKFLGHQDVRILDGGYQAWLDQELPTTQAATKLATSQFKVTFQENRLAELEDITSGLKQENCQIVDNRSKSEFTGSRGIGARVGHIPGATHLEWSELIREDGKYLETDAMKELLRRKGIDLEQPIKAHCQTGGRSAVAAFAFEMLGAKQIQNYYRGWGEYSGALSSPVEK